MMLQKLTLTLLFLTTLAIAESSELERIIHQAMTGLEVKSSGIPYSKAIHAMRIGYDADGRARVGIAYRKIKSFKTITGLVIVHRTDQGYVLHEALFPDIKKIKNAKDRKQVASVIESFKNVPFDPHAEKSAVDGLSGATRYGLRTSGYLNYIARRIALDMETRPDWAKTPSG